MDQFQAYDTIQTPQTLDAMQEKVSFRYNQQLKLIGRVFLQSGFGVGVKSALSWFMVIEVYHLPSGQSWKLANFTT